MSDTATLGRLFAGIQHDLAVVEQTFQERASSGLDVLNLASAHALSSPGKRLRTALTLLSGKLGDYRFEKLLLVSVAFEMVHLATLIHDDIIDHADTRRGIPTVNAQWGERVALLLGDYLFARTAGVIAELNETRVIRLFSETVATVCEGTIQETLSAGQFDLSVEAYLERIACKTACLMAACCKGGRWSAIRAQSRQRPCLRLGCIWGRRSKLSMMCLIIPAQQSASASQQATTYARA